MTELTRFRLLPKQPPPDAEPSTTAGLSGRDLADALLQREAADPAFAGRAAAALDAHRAARARRLAEEERTGSALPPYAGELSTGELTHFARVMSDQYVER